MSNRIADILVTETNGSKSMVDAFSIAAVRQLDDNDGKRTVLVLKDVHLASAAGLANSAIYGYTIDVKETPEEILALKKQAFEDCLNMGG